MRKPNLCMLALLLGAADGNAQEAIPRAVSIARATAIPRCALFVDAAAQQNGNGTVASPFRTITAAVSAAAAGGVICVSEGIYPEELQPGEKPIVLAGGFQRGSRFSVRNSAAFVSKAQGRGRGAFLAIRSDSPKANELTAVDGFEITGYENAVLRDHYESQRFDLTNNHIHGNRCAPDKVGAGFFLNNVSGSIIGNVIRNNTCGRGGAGFINDSSKSNTILVERNLIDGNVGSEPQNSHGGGLYFFATTLRVNGNVFIRNTVSGWGGGLFIGADIGSGQKTTATLNWNVYRDNRASIAGGGFFCDEGATCRSYHEIYYRNCGGNIYLDSGSGGGPTVATFDHLTAVYALTPDCQTPGDGVRIDRGDTQPDSYRFVNAIFWGNATGRDFGAVCDAACGNVRISISYSMVQPKHDGYGFTIDYGEGNIAPVDPMFADLQNGDFHLKSRFGRWTPGGHVQDEISSPALARGYPPDGAPQSANPTRAGARHELGAYGNSPEASFVY